MIPFHVVERPERDQLGETPFWDEESQTLFWCDIVGKAVRRLDPSSGRIERWPMPDFCSGVVPTTDGQALVMLVDGVYRLDLETGKLQAFAKPESDPRNRCNEVRTDPQGRLWLGTMANNIGPDGEDIEGPPTTGSVFCIGPDGFSRRVLGDIKITNTFCWSPDGSRFYTADTPRRVIWSYAYDPEGPTLTDGKVFIEGDIAPGNPDGASMDEEGCLWSARWGGNRVIRLTPDGTVDREIVLPAEQPSSCAFGGPDRRTLYVTSARQGMKAPTEMDGQLYAADVGVVGMAMPRFRT